MIEIPWYMRSPSPWSILLYIVAGIYVYRQIRPTAQVSYKRFPRLLAMIDSAFIVAFVVVLLDAMWILACAFRWGYLYPQDVPQLWMGLARDLLGALLFYLLIGGYFRIGQLKISRMVLAIYLLNAAFLGAWFIAAESPALTDWNYAWRHGYELETVIRTFLISHVLGRIPFLLIFPFLFVNRGEFYKPFKRIAINREVEAET